MAWNKSSSLSSGTSPASSLENKFLSSSLLSLDLSTSSKYLSKSDLLKTSENKLLCSSLSSSSFLSEGASSSSSLYSSTKNNFLSSGTFLSTSSSFGFSHNTGNTSDYRSRLGSVSKTEDVNPVSLKRSLSQTSECEPCKKTCIVPDEADLPEYCFSDEETESENVDEELSIQFAAHETDEKSLKLSFVTLASTSLVHFPKWKNPDDPTRNSLIELADKLAEKDPEFVLKVALYVRQELNIRSTANFLLAYSSLKPECSYYLKKYFNAAICLPSDWLEVAEISQTFRTEQMHPKGNLKIPTSLRKVMVESFEKFDKYQLAKYNKVKSKTKKKKKDAKDVKEDEEIADEPKTKAVYTLKKLIQYLHIRNPAEHVMCLLGKKYPANIEDFRKSGLSGMWDQDCAGKRMKLPVPETWETQLALRGNTAKVWEELIDNKKLPYMASLRNLRNILLAGVSLKHHNKVMKFLSEESFIIRSRQFPQRYLAAYQVLEDLENSFQRIKEGSMVTSEKLEKWKKKRTEQIKEKIAAAKFDEELLTKYKESINKAIQVSVDYNLDPIPGTTLILCDMFTSGSLPNAESSVSVAMKQTSCQALFLALICVHACEGADLKILSKDSSWSSEPDVKTFMLKNVLELAGKYESRGSGEIFYNEHFQTLLNEYISPVTVQRKQIDTLVFFTTGEVFDATIGPDVLKTFTKAYRAFVNPNLLFVQVDVKGSSSKNSCQELENPLDVHLSGFSDQILKFIAARGNEKLLNAVENVDRKYQLKSLTNPRPKPRKQTSLVLEHPVVTWKTAKVFISSTFRDMHGERNLLINYVFPELQRRASALFVHVYEIDLRWGVTEDESKDGSFIEICLGQAKEADFFIGILGERYGLLCDVGNLPKSPTVDWIKTYKQNSSITELEIYHSALRNPEDNKDRAFFYFRDASYEKNIPEEWKADFLCENNTARGRMIELKQKIHSSELKSFDGYPCTWGGSSNGCPFLAGLEEFGKSVLNDLWCAVKSKFSNEDPDFEVESHCANQKYLSKGTNFIGREKILNECLQHVESRDTSFIVLSGKPGMGKTALLAKLYQQTKSQAVTVVQFITGSTINIFEVFFKIGNALQEKLGLSLYNSQKEFSPLEFQELLQRSSELSPKGKTVLLIDNFDKMDIAGFEVTDWIPKQIPEGVKIICTVNFPSQTITKLEKHFSELRHSLVQLKLQPLTLMERRLLISSIFAPHRKSLEERAFQNQSLSLITKRDSGVPLYLQLVCNQLLSFGVFDQLQKKITGMPETISLLLDGFLNELESLYEKDVVKLMFGILSLARGGLKEHNLHKLLSVALNNSLDEDVEDLCLCFMEFKPKNLLPAVTFISFIHSLSRYNFIETENDQIVLIDSDGVRKALDRYQFHLCDFTVAVQRLLAAFYLHEVDPSPDMSWRGKNPDSFVNLVHYLLASSSFRFTDLSYFGILSFLSAAASLGCLEAIKEQLFSLQNDVLSKLDHGMIKIIEDYKTFFQRQHSSFERFPNFMYQQALLEDPDSSVYIDAVEMFHEWHFEPTELHQNSHFSQKLYSNVITAVAVSCEGELAALGGEDGIIRVISISSGKVEAIFSGHTDAISRVLFTKEKQLCSSSFDNNLCLWDLKNKKKVSAMNEHCRKVTDFCCDDTGHFVVSVSWDGTLRQWSTQDGRHVSCISSEKKPINCIKPIPNSLLVVTGGWDKTLRIWDLVNLTRVAILKGHSAAIRSLAVSPSGMQIVSAAMNNEIFLWSPITGALVAKLDTPSSQVVGLCFHPADHSLISYCRDATLKVWFDHDVPVKSFSIDIKQSEVSCLAFVPPQPKPEDNLFLVIGLSNGSLCTLNPNTGEVFWSGKNLETEATHIWYCVFAFAKYVIVRTSSSSIEVYELRKHGSLDYFKSLFMNKGKVSCVGQTDKYLMLGTEEGLLMCYDLFLDQLLAEVQAHSLQISSCVKKSPTEVITASYDNTVRLWEIREDLKKILQKDVVNSCHKDWITGAAHQKKVLVTGSQDSTLKIWKSNQVSSTLTGLNSSVFKIFIKENLVIGCSSNGSAAVWNLNGKLITQVPELSTESRITDFGFIEGDKNSGQPSSLLQAVWNNGNQIHLHKPFHITKAHSLQGHSGPVLDVGLNEQNTLVSSSSDGMVIFWNLSLASGMSSRESQSVHEGKVTVLQASKRNGRIITGGTDGCLYLWECTEQKKKILCTVAANNLEVISDGSFQDYDGTKAVILFSKKAENQELTSYMLRKYGFISSGTSTSVSLLGELPLHEHITCLKCSLEKEYTAAASQKKRVFLMNSDLSVLLYLNITSTFLTDMFFSKDYLVFADTEGFIKHCSVVDYPYKVNELISPETCNMKGFFFTKVMTDVNCIYGSTNTGVFVVAKKSFSPLLYQIHDSNITSFCMWEDFIFTCSLDKYIKVWKKDTMKQVGQFCSPVPVTVIELQNSSGKSSVTLFYGTSVGEIKTLIWKKP